MSVFFSVYSPIPSIIGVLVALCLLIPLIILSVWYFKTHKSVSRSPSSASSFDNPFFNQEMYMNQLEVSDNSGQQSLFRKRGNCDSKRYTREGSVFLHPWMYFEKYFLSTFSRGKAKVQTQYIVKEIGWLRRERNHEKSWTFYLLIYII